MEKELERTIQAIKELFHCVPVDTQNEILGNLEEIAIDLIDYDDWKPHPK